MLWALLPAPARTRPPQTGPRACARSSALRSPRRLSSSPLQACRSSSSPLRSCRSRRPMRLRSRAADQPARSQWQAAQPPAGRRRRAVRCRRRPDLRARRHRLRHPRTATVISAASCAPARPSWSAAPRAFSWRRGGAAFLTGGHCVCSETQECGGGHTGGHDVCTHQLAVA